MYLMNIWNKFKYSPLLRLVRDVISKIGVSISPIYIVEERFQEGASLQHTYESGHVSIDCLTMDDMRMIADLPFRKVKTEKLIERLHEGQKCLALRCNGEIASFIWIDYKKCYLSGCGFKLNDNEAYLYDSYTFAKYRGYGFAPYLRYECYMRLVQEGRTFLYSAVDVFNGPALKVLRKLNAKKLELWMRIFFFGKRHIIFHMKKYHFGDDTFSSARA
ncbi:MAG: hypothetical protein JW938_05150 [Candidatus Omnitrophica bacterium]|nr:hypothetical protein [Candidatus Omnitrophota bacterium]